MKLAVCAGAVQDCRSARPVVQGQESGQPGQLCHRQKFFLHFDQLMALALQ